jgi:threonine synthase
MDVGDPSNFVRILEIFHKEFKALSSVLTSFSISDEQTKEAIRKVYTDSHYLPDPHGAVGWLALEEYLSAHPGEKGIFLETAHPVKFYDVVEPIIQQQVPMPASVQSLLGRQKQSKKMTPDFNILKEFLLAENGK